VTPIAEIAAAFAGALPLAIRPRDATALGACVEVAWRCVCAAHPGCGVSPIALFAFIGERIRAGDPAAELGRRHVPDLYVACGCDHGDPVALTALERDVLPGVQRSLARLRLGPDDRSEVMQVLRERMLVARAGCRGIAAYDGRAPLAMWLRVYATRLGQRHASRGRRMVDLDGELDQIAPGVPDPELAYFKRHYGAQFRAAFGAAVASLTARERTLLRYSVTDELGIDQIAAIYHVHRATAARQLAQARRALAEATRQGMQRALGISGPELESIMRILMSLTDAALQRIFTGGRGDDELRR
jgi:RNA polymerase sigma-70 factor (ECF subfamily)